MITHASMQVQKGLWQLSCKCIQQADIPKEWKHAVIYPVPKPKPWEYHLDRVRPITLLKTARKITVKVIIKRITNMFSQHNILKGNNYAALPGGSTFEPIRIL